MKIQANNHTQEEETQKQNGVSWRASLCMCMRSSRKYTFLREDPVLTSAVKYSKIAAE